MLNPENIKADEIRGVMCSKLANHIIAVYNDITIITWR
jgi:hypothetical protein